jgi:hypothetical protein
VSGRQPDTERAGIFRAPCGTAVTSGSVIAPSNSHCVQVPPHGEELFYALRQYRVNSPRYCGANNQNSPAK